MKLVKTASGKQQIKMSKSEWEDLGKKAGWTKEAQDAGDEVILKLRGGIDKLENTFKEVISDLLPSFMSRDPNVLAITKDFNEAYHLIREVSLKIDDMKG